ncbi:hypothetical protein E2C01_051257 [Portunus trituberculatus]|uniref:Uncharacterized protein n=1 Tax=Portunus trituberculatus TaxID=210409 RepID=A0A5B7GAH8_PORTR|nr:hypothetical protein [Portunus trituberculatus]
MLTDIRVAFRYLDKDVMKKIITSMIHPKLEYAAVVLEPKDLPYKERLKEMELPTLQDRRERGELITLYKIVNGIEMDKQNLVLVTEKLKGQKGMQRSGRGSV